MEVLKQIEHGKRDWWLMVLLSFLSTFPRLFYLNVPFERDEGAYAYISDVIQRGGIPYLDAFDHKPPAVYYFYRLAVELFGHSVAAPRLLATLFVAATSFLVMLLVLRYTRNLTATLIAGIVLGVASSSPAYTGFNANTEIFAMPFMMGGVLLLAKDHPHLRSFFWSGLLFGTGLMVKQPVIAVAVAVYVVHLFQSPRRLLQNGPVFVLGTLIPLMLCTLYFMSKGAVKAFWNGVFVYNLGYIEGPSLSDTLNSAFNQLVHILGIDPFTWIAGGVGLIIILLSKFHIFQKQYICAALLGATIATSMGKYFHPHYFVFMLPFLSVSAGCGLGIIIDDTTKWRMLKVPFLILCAGVLWNFRYLMVSDQIILQFCYGDIPFYRSKVVGNYLKDIISEGQSAYIIGSEPQIYFYSGLHASSRIFYFYPLTQSTKQQLLMRSENDKDIQRTPPDYLIFINHKSSAFYNLEDPFIRTLFRRFASYRLLAISINGYDAVIDDEESILSFKSRKNDASIYIYQKKSTPSFKKLPTFGDLLGVGA
jgi:Dolichyl-phosphate-mannose-protein mannosyltransferase